MKVPCGIELAADNTGPVVDVQSNQGLAHDEKTVQKRGTKPITAMGQDLGIPGFLNAGGRFT